jgi:hypothetical protein
MGHESLSVSAKAQVECRGRLKLRPSLRQSSGHDHECGPWAGSAQDLNKGDAQQDPDIVHAVAPSSVLGYSPGNSASRPFTAFSNAQT